MLSRAILAVIGAGLIWLLAVWPPPVWYRTHWPAETAFMDMRAHQDRGVMKGSPTERDRAYHPVRLDSIARSAWKAVMIGEDDNFWVHGGIDYQALRRALGYRRDEFSWTSARDRAELLPLLRGAWAKREALRGASTITQQLAKNLYLSPSRNPLRKIKEAVTAYRLEAALGKPRILELYLNVVELGDGIWGFDAASERYFRRPASRLSVDQAAALAASLPFPLSSNPEHRPARMRWRQQLILRRMRGEKVEVPKVEADLPLPTTPDSVESPPAIARPDSAADQPMDTVQVAAPEDSAPP